jgi:TPR repeat protein
MKHALILFAAVLTATASAAQENMGAMGTLNPDELTWQSQLDKAQRGETNMTVCASGYMMTKSGDHAAARAIFEACANDGYTGAMTWMGQLENNGLGGAYDPDAAAAWDKRAADAGDPVGKFNYGLALLRGHGVAQNEALGRRYVDTAANEGLKIARRLQGANYDPDEVTPDADNWKYAPLF